MQAKFVSLGGICLEPPCFLSVPDTEPVCVPALSCPIWWLPTIELATFFRPSPSCWSSGPSGPSPLPATGVGCRELVDKRRGWEFDVWAEGRLCAPTLQRCAYIFLKGAELSQGLCAVTLPTLLNTNIFISKQLRNWKVVFFKRDNFVFII